MWLEEKIISYIWHNHCDKSTKRWSLKMLFWERNIHWRSRQLLSRLCLVQICWKLVALRSTGGNSDFKLILWIENISSTKQSFQLTNIETGALGLTLILSNICLNLGASIISDGLVCSLSWSGSFLNIINWLHYDQTMYLAGWCILDGRNELLEVSKWNISVCNISSSLPGGNI